MTKRPYANIYDRHCSVKRFEILRNICIGNNIITVTGTVLVEDASVMVVIIRVTFKGEGGILLVQKFAPLSNCFRMARD